MGACTARGIGTARCAATGAAYCVVGALVGGAPSVGRGWASAALCSCAGSGGATLGGGPKSSGLRAPEAGLVAPGFGCGCGGGCGGGG